MRPKTPPETLFGCYMCMETVMIQKNIGYKGNNDMRILVVEDERDMNSIITRKLESENYSVDFCYDGVSALEYIRLAEYDGVILDVMLPKMNGFEVLKQLRSEGNRTPILLLSARSETEDKVRGLDLGADDYLTKPFDFPELMARLRVLLRKQTGVKENIYRCGELEVNVNEQKVVREGRVINLSPREFAILLYMIRNQNIVLSRDQIEANVWSLDNETNSNVVDVYIRYLRRKLDDDFDKKLIQTIRGAGYMLKNE